MAPATIYPRYAEYRLLEAIEDSPIVSDTWTAPVWQDNPRPDDLRTRLHRIDCPATQFQTVSHILLLTAYPGNYEYISLDDDNLRVGAQEDPVGFVDDLPENVVLDEVQRAPELFTALKLAVDRNPQAWALRADRILQHSLA